MDNQILNLINSELDKARAKHPNWPPDRIHQAAILAEEAGEVVQASLKLQYEGGSIQHLHDEVIQTAAMCIRILENC